MEFKEFTEEIMRHLAERNDKLDISIQTVRKNNSVQYTGVSIRNIAEDAAPVIYLEPYYRQFRDTADMERVVDEIIRVYEQNNFRFNPNEICDFSLVKDKIVYTVINEHRNKDLLKEVPHRYLVDDIAVTYKILLGHSGDGMSASIRVNNHLMDLWSAKEELLWTFAETNTNRLQKPMYIGLEELIKGMLSGEHLASNGFTKKNINYTGLEMFVATNEEKLNGASVMADKVFMKKLQSEIGVFYIIPSSIHEIIAVPASGEFEVDALSNMLRDVNSTVLSEEDYLSDIVYKYDGAVLTVA